MTGLPDIPATCAARPTVGGLVQPYVNVRLADGGVDFRAADNTRYQKVWRDRLCQTCGGPLGTVAVFFGGPNQLTNRIFDEPHVCAPCAVYVSRACPMVAGRRATYASGPSPAEGHRGKLCTVPGCDCIGWVESVPGQNAAGEPAHDWYAVYVPAPNGWVLTADKQTITVNGTLVEQTLINGGMLTVEPRKVVHVSTPGLGRIWTRTSMPPAAPDACQRDKPTKEDTCPVSVS